MKFLIFYQTGERFLKQDPNYAQHQISMFNAAKCFNKEEKQGSRKQKPTG